MKRHYNKGYHQLCLPGGLTASLIIVLLSEIIHCWNYSAVVKHSEACQLVLLGNTNRYSAALIKKEKKKVHPVVGWTLPSVLELALLLDWAVLNGSITEQPLSLCLIAEESIKVYFPPSERKRSLIKMWPIWDSVTGVLSRQSPLNLKAWMHPERKFRPS